MSTDMNRVLTAAGIGAVAGLAEGFIVGKGAKRSAIDYVNNRFKADQLQIQLTKELDLVDAVTKDPVEGDVTALLLRSIDTSTPEGQAAVDTIENIKKMVDIDPSKGVNTFADLDKAALDQVGTVVAPEVLTQAQLRTDVSVKIGNIAADIIRVKIKEFQDLSKMGIAPTDDALMKLILDGVTAQKKGDPVAVDLIVDVFKYIKNRSNQGVEGVEEIDSLIELSGRRQDLVDILTKFSDKTYEGSGLYNAVLKAFDTSLSEAGRSLQAGSRVGQLLAAHGSFTKEQRKALKAAFSSPDGTVLAHESLMDAFNKFGRIRRSLMTITPATTARNIFSGLTNVTFATGANTIESIVYNMGRMATDKNYSFGKGLRDIYLDSFGLLTNLVMSNRTAGRAFTDAALINHPTLMRKLLRNNAEFGEGKNLPEIANFLNGLNIASDGFFRRALFSYELDKRFRRAGLEGFKDVMLEGKTIPSEYLEKAAEETLKGTFSYSFKRGKGRSEHLAASFIDFVETVPAGTVLFPFARFMANSIAFQFQYSPANTAMAAMNMVSTATANMFRKEKDKAKLDYAGLSQAFSRGAVGTAALYAAIKIRSEQQENPYWKLTIGDSDIDTRPLFPIAPYMLLADLIIKTGGFEDEEVKAVIKDGLTEGSAPLGIKEIAEGIAGLNMRSTGQLPMFDALFGLAQKDETGGYFGEDKVGTAVGEFMSAYFKTPFVGTNFVKDLMASFDQTEAVIRDTKAGVEGLGFQERATSSFGESFKQVLPVAGQQALGLEPAPVRNFALRKGPAFRQNTLAKQTLGTRMELPPTEIEREMNALGLPEWQTFRPSGDRVADSYTRYAHSKHALGVIRGIMTSDMYKDMSRGERSVLMNNVISATKKEAKLLGESFNLASLHVKNIETQEEIRKEMDRLTNKLGHNYDSNGNFLGSVEKPTEEHLKNRERLNTLWLMSLQSDMYMYTGPFARMRWLDNVDKRTKSLVNEQLKNMYRDILAGDYTGNDDVGSIILLSAKKYGPENLTIEKTGLYGLGHELGKVLKGYYK